MMTFVPRHREPPPAVAPRPNQVGYDPELAFTIRRGESLADYVGYDTAIDVAQHFKLEVRDAGRQISYARARTRTVNRLDVNVIVAPGDRFDLNGPRSGWKFAAPRPRVDRRPLAHLAVRAAP